MNKDGVEITRDVVVIKRSLFCTLVLALDQAEQASDGNVPQSRNQILLIADHGVPKWTVMHVTLSVCQTMFRVMFYSDM